MNILIADQLNSTELRILLESLGHNIISQTLTGESTIGKIKDIKPDLVFINLQLKGDMSGVETAHKVTEKGIPVVFITTFIKSCLNKSWQLPEDAVVLSYPLTLEKLEYSISRTINE